MRRISLSLIAVAVFFHVAPSFAVCSTDESLNNSGQEQLVCIDTNQDGQIDPDEDCCLTGGVSTIEGATSTTSGGDLCLNAEQDDSEDQKQIFGCGERTTYTGSATPTSLTLYNQHGPSPGVPGFNGLAVEGSDGSSSATTFGNGIPHVSSVELGIPLGSVLGEGQLCSAGGPAIELKDAAGNTYVARLVPLTSNEVRYLCTMAPLELEDGTADMFNVCWPVDEDGNSVIQTVNGQVVDTTLLPFGAALPPCAGNRMAPTASQYGLLALALALLAGGTWLLRRSSFASDLPAA